MKFYERLVLFDFLYLIFTKQRGFYLKKTFSVRLFEFVASKVGLDLTEVTRLEIGHVQTATNLRESAYQHAMHAMEKIQIANWQSLVSRLYNINFDVISNKYLFEEIYAKYFFLELVLQYSEEHSLETHLLKVDALFVEPYLSRLKGEVRFFITKKFEVVNFFNSIFLAPFVLVIILKRNLISESVIYNNKIICVVDERSTYEMFSELFKGNPNVRYVIEKPYVHSFAKNRLKELGIRTLGLSRKNLVELVKTTIKYLIIALSCRLSISEYGEHAVQLMWLVIKGRTLTIQGKGNSLVTFEHLTIARAVRNEFLSSQECLSIFVPKNCYVTYQQFPAEVWINYDVVCSSGKHAEELYKKKLALTKLFLPTGSYDVHKALSDMRLGKVQELEKLAAFKGKSILVAVMARGVCDETYSCELRLMQLAVELSKNPSVKVVVRQKPAPRVSKYHDFYESILNESDNILLTGSEYALFDFVNIADIVVTSASTSVFDLAMVGSKVLFVDFMKTPSLYLPWVKVPEIVVNEKDACDQLLSLCSSSPMGSTRQKHMVQMERLVDYVGYRFEDFESYKDNFKTQLLPYLPQTCRLNSFR